MENCNDHRHDARQHVRRQNDRREGDRRLSATRASGRVTSRSCRAAPTRLCRSSSSAASTRTRLAALPMPQSRARRCLPPWCPRTRPITPPRSWTALRPRRTRDRTRARNGSAESVPIVEEGLVVGKAKFATGGVRVTSSVEELPVEETVTLREERVSAEQRPADRELTAEEAKAAFEEKTVEVIGTTEEARVSKKPGSSEKWPSRRRSRSGRRPCVTRSARPTSRSRKSAPSRARASSLRTAGTTVPPDELESPARCAGLSLSGEPQGRCRRPSRRRRFSSDRVCMVERLVRKMRGPIGRE